MTDLPLPQDLARAIPLALTTLPRPPFGPHEDPNTADIIAFGRLLSSHVGAPLPSPPGKGDGVTLVDLLDKVLIAGTLIRNADVTTIEHRSVSLFEQLAANNVSFSAPTQLFVGGLFAWHGCINMAKLCRQTYVAGTSEQAYEMHQRTSGYLDLRSSWEHEENRGNPWVRYGASLALHLEKKRQGRNFGDRVVNAWVPPGPYWDLE